MSKCCFSSAISDSNLFICSLSSPHIFTKVINCSVTARRESISVLLVSSNFSILNESVLYLIDHLYHYYQREKDSFCQFWLIFRDTWINGAWRGLICLTSPVTSNGEKYSCSYFIQEQSRCLVMFTNESNKSKVQAIKDLVDKIVYKSTGRLIKTVVYLNITWPSSSLSQISVAGSSSLIAL